MLDDSRGNKNVISSTWNVAECQIPLNVEKGGKLLVPCGPPWSLSPARSVWRSCLQSRCIFCNANLNAVACRFFYLLF
jgi:hypothetical protein